MKKLGLVLRGKRTSLVVVGLKNDVKGVHRAGSKGQGPQKTSDEEVHATPASLEDRERRQKHSDDARADVHVEEVEVVDDAGQK